MAIQEEISLGRVGLALGGALEKAEGHKGIEEIARRAWVQPQPAAEGLGRLRTTGQFAEHPHLDGAQQHLGRPEGKSRLQDRLRTGMALHHACGWWD